MKGTCTDLTERIQPDQWERYIVEGQQVSRSGNIVMEATCSGIKIIVTDETFCEPNSSFLKGVAFAVIKAAAKATGIKIEFFKDGKAVCESRRVLRNGRMLEEKSITSEYKVEIGANDFVAGVYSPEDLQDKFDNLNDENKEEFENELKSDLIEVDGIEEDDIPVEFSTSSEAEATIIEDDSSDDASTFLYVGLAVAALVGVAVVVGFVMTRKPHSGSYDHRSGSGSGKPENDTFNNEDKFTNGL